jgi:ferredoxin-type protein NapG
MFRRKFFRILLGALAFFLPVIGIGFKRAAPGKSKRFLRPPGALKENEFKKQCIGCFKCATACPNDCIEMASFDYGFENVHTPVIQPRNRGCTLCMRCTEVCPTGALQKVDKEPEVVLKEVKMGTAEVDPNLCFSFHGRTCGVCYRACPFPGQALEVGMFEQPKVNPDVCVGCGLCEQACIHMPQAIRVYKKELS